MVPRRCPRLTHAGEEKLDHKAVAVAGVGHGAVPEVVVDDGHRSSPAAEGQFFPLVGLFRRIIVLSGRQNRGRSHVQANVLRIVEGHGPAGAVVADVLVVFIAVLVHALALGPAGIVVAVAVRVDEVGGAEEALEGTVNGGVSEDLV